MTKLFAAAAASALLALGAAPATAESIAERGEARLAEMLEGRVAGEPQACITTMRSGNRLRVVENVGLVYDAGSTIYVARATNPESLSWTDVPVIDRFSPSRLCRTDMMTTIDRSTGFFSGVLFIEEFVPYTRG